MISKLESEESGVSEEEAREFSAGEATQKEEEPEEEEDSEDLVSAIVNRGSYIRCHTFLNLLNKLREISKMQGCAEHLISFRQQYK